MTSGGVLNGGIPSGTKMVFYQDTAPSGWTIDATVDDKLLFVSKGSVAGGETGGGAHSTGTWTIAGVTVDAHTHTGAAHVHKVYEYNNNTGDDTLFNSIGGVQALTAQAKNAMRWSLYANQTATTSPPDFYTSSAGAGATGAASADTITSDATWRPAAYVVIIATKD